MNIENLFLPPCENPFCARDMSLAVGAKARRAIIFLCQDCVDLANAKAQFKQPHRTASNYISAHPNCYVITRKK